METYFLAFVTFFITVGPVDVAAVFSALTANYQVDQRRLAWLSVTIAGGILFFFCLVGDSLLEYLGVSVSALRIAGGMLLLLTSIDLVFKAHSTSTGVSKHETKEARMRDDLAVFPLAIPLMAGPAAITSALVLTANAKGDLLEQGMIAAALASVLLLALFFMLFSRLVLRVLGKIGTSIFTRIMGLLLTALATQFILDGLKNSGLFD